MRIELEIDNVEGSFYVPAFRHPSGDFFDPELRADIAREIRRFPNTEAQWWIGPEAVLGVVEQFLARIASGPSA